MPKKKRKSFLPKIAMFIFISIVFVYTAYHLVNLFFTDDIKTIISGVTTESSTVSGTGYVFRDESPLTSGVAGAVDYAVSDGEKIAQNQTIANVYRVSSQSQGILAKRMLALTDKQIALLKKSELSSAEATDFATLQSDAGDTYYKILNLIADRDTSELAVQTEKMMVTMNKINVMKAEDNSSVTASLAILEAQRSSYLVGEHMQQVSPRSGYFYYTVDGFEYKFNTAALEGMTANEFYSLISYYQKTEPKIDSAVYGKLADTTVWKFAIPISQKKAASLEDGKEYKVNFKENNNTTLVMTLESRIESDARQETILIFECNRLPDNFVLSRCQNAEIEISSIEGIYVPLSAMENLNGVRGVYVLRGSVVHFRRVDVIYNGIDYCLVAKSGEADDSYKYLGTNELIITNGKNLFDGRILG